MQALRALSVLLILVCALASTDAVADASRESAPNWTGVSRVSLLREGIAWQRAQAWQWQDAAGLRRSPAAYHERRETSVPYLRWIVSLWNDRRDRAFRKYKILLRTRPAHYAGWLCIHGGTKYGAAYGTGEGSWTAQTGNGFYGGLQMTYNWMGLVVNAALLSPLEQMRAAEEGYQRSGYSSSWMAGQWPNTYPPCARFFA